MQNRRIIWNLARSFRLVALWGLIFVSSAAGQGAEPLRVQAKLRPGPYYVGEGFELRVSVVAVGQRPRMDPPRIAGAVTWKIGTELERISSTDIGSITNEETRFLTRFRVVARRSGVLDIPSIKVQIGKDSGRTQPLHAAIRPVPLEGRPAEFLGGVGRFEPSAEAVPNVVRVGQELDFRIKVTGPAAWGMTTGPDLARYSRINLGLRIEPGPDQVSDEPPVRTFVYRLRPTRAGEAVLPPVAIVAFDPAHLRFETRVTAGVPIRVVAVPALDPRTIDGGESMHDSGHAAWVQWSAWGLSAGLLLGGYASLLLVRRRLRRKELHGPTVASRYAARLARSLRSIDPSAGLSRGLRARAPARFPQPYQDAAHRVTLELIHYLQLGIGRPAGALTPDEARLGVEQVTGSPDLGGLAASITARCDLALYAEARGEPSARELLESARAFFEALGRANTRRWWVR
jgi:hypothetical protein